MAVDQAAAAARSGKGKGKKKGAKFNPMPTVHAAEDSLPWRMEFSARSGRHAVASVDLPAGALVLVEQPFLRLPLSKYAAAVCTRCLRVLQPDGRVPDPGNPCLPRYCPKCRELPHPADAQLAALRIKLPEIAEANGLDTIILNIVTSMDMQRSGIAGVGALADEDFPKISNPIQQSFDDVRCSVGDSDTLPNGWDRKPEEWRKKIGPAIRALHKELTALAEAGTVPGYTPSPITRLQADAAMVSAHAHAVAGPNALTDTGVGMFPALLLFPHSCVPNCAFTVANSRVFVRTMEPVPAGTPLTVAVTPLTEPRAARSAALESQRGMSCVCPRCVEPLESSPDRLLEGVVCVACGMDVMLPLKSIAENNAAWNSWRADYLESKEKEAARSKKGKKKGNSGKKDAEASEAAEGGDEDELPETIPEGVRFWRCCGCHHLEPGQTVAQSGADDVLGTAQRYLQQGLALMSTKHAELSAQGEAYLEMVANGMDGRLSVHHQFVTAATRPLMAVYARRGDGLKALNAAVQLWSMDREILGGRPSQEQAQYLETVIDAAGTKASAVSSAVIKRQLERKVKQAKEELARLRPVLTGEGVDKVDKADKAAAALTDGAAQ